MKGCIDQGITILFGKLLTEECGFIGKARDEGLR